MYAHVERLLAEERAVILDGGVATELQRLRPLRGEPGPDPELWGTWGLYRAPGAVKEVHARYVAAGCDVISTDTWSILSAPAADARAADEPTHWMDVARLGVRLAREAIAEAGRDGECAVAFAISEDVNSPEREATVELLARVLEEEPPDLVLLETLTLLREPGTFEAVGRLLETGLPVWLSFRRCRHGVCGVFGQHWGPPEGDAFGRAARRFEELGVAALAINCLPVDHVPGMLSWLRDSPRCRSASIRTSGISPASSGASTTAPARRSMRSSRAAGARRAPRSSAAAAARPRSTSAPPRPRSRA